MRRNHFAMILIVIAVTAFAFFVPVVYDPPFQRPIAPTGGYEYLVSITYFWTGYGGTYYYNIYQVYL